MSKFIFSAALSAGKEMRVSSTRCIACFYLIMRSSSYTHITISAVKLQSIPTIVEITHLTRLHFPMCTDTDALDLYSSLLAATEQVSCTSKLRRHCQQSQIISDGQTHAPFASDA